MKDILIDSTDDHFIVVSIPESEAESYQKRLESDPDFVKMKFSKPLVVLRLIHVHYLLGILNIKVICTKEILRQLLMLHLALEHLINGLQVLGGLLLELDCKVNQIVKKG